MTDKTFKYLLLFMLFIPRMAVAQQYVYVNTKNLILRDRPQPQYMVFAVLQPPCKLKIEKYDPTYKNNKAVQDKFYRVSYTLKDDRGFGHYTGGWVEKKYIVTKLSEISAPGVDTNLSSPPSQVSLISYMGTDEDDPNEWNYMQYPYPKYKGGEKHFIAAGGLKRIYHIGARGGCYYLSGTGRKVYVDKKYCVGIKRKKIRKKKTK